MKIRKLTAQEIECRVAQVTAKGCSLLLYKTARVDRAILDELFGDLWQNDFKLIDGKMYGGIGIYNKELQQWLWRWDCGTESNTEAEKGQASDCFKRAGFKWGIGIELYSAPFIWLNIETEKNTNGKYQLKNKYAKFTVKSIDYDSNGTISDLFITDNANKVVYKFPPDKTIKRDPDIDIIEGLKATDNSANAERYYNQYKEHVNNLEEFKKVYAQIWKQHRKKEKADVA